MGLIKKLLRSKWVWLLMGAIGIFVVGGKIRQTAENLASKVKPGSNTTGGTTA
jgi:hypothetical protein